MLLLTLHLADKSFHMFESFKKYWSLYKTECQICLEPIESTSGIVGLPDTGMLNLEKMFHAECIQRWRREHTRDPFNRHIKYYFTFPPPTVDECKNILKEIKGFIGDQEIDRVYSALYQRITNEQFLDIELDFRKFLKGSNK